MYVHVVIVYGRSVIVYVHVVIVYGRNIIVYVHVEFESFDPSLLLHTDL